MVLSAFCLLQGQRVTSLLLTCHSIKKPNQIQFRRQVKQEQQETERAKPGRSRFGGLPCGRAVLPVHHHLVKDTQDAPKRRHETEIDVQTGQFAPDNLLRAVVFMAFRWARAVKYQRYMAVHGGTNSTSHPGLALAQRAART